MRTVQNADAAGEKKQAAAECGMCREAVTWVLLNRVRTMVERCARGAGDIAIEAPLFAFGAEQMPGAFIVGNSNFRRHACGGKQRSFSAEGMHRKTRADHTGSPSISYRPSGSGNSRGRK